MPLPASLTLATRGSPLALAQAKTVAAACRAAFPELSVELKIIRTTGDKLQKASMAKPDAGLPKGLFTKELEVALIEGEADLAVHSLKDLPTDLPAGLTLGAVLKRADPRDVLIYRSLGLADSLRSSAGGATLRGAGGQSVDRTVGDGGSAQPRPTGEGVSGGSAQPRPTSVRRGFPAHLRIADLPEGAVIASSSTRRREQLLALRTDLRVIEIRGNVGTRLLKLAEGSEFDATMLAAAGLARLGFRIQGDGRLIPPETVPAAEPGSVAAGISAPEGLLAVALAVDEMVPCVGQAAIGIEVRATDPRMAEVCARLNHVETFQCVTAERAFLHALGGGCQSPVAAFAEFTGAELRIRGVSFRSGPARQAEVVGPAPAASQLGEQLARALSEGNNA